MYPREITDMFISARKSISLNLFLSSYSFFLYIFKVICSCAAICKYTSIVIQREKHGFRKAVKFSMQVADRASRKLLISGSDPWASAAGTQARTPDVLRKHHWWCVPAHLKIYLRISDVANPYGTNSTEHALTLPLWLVTASATQ